ncbi:pilus assembly protein [Afifella sp. IM 167]|uniref:pilus assembly protein n=1 Tax=Afifella sp. IM 167 TaxID=2033586 RepID=UPI001CCB0AFD|nr:pilus assembly protein [Afifella sp. IM 167]MBZ8132659.1 hypothetical protein [Afifella sp. IM 167]
MALARRTLRKGRVFFRFAGIARQYRSEEEGVVAILFALALIPLLGLAAGAVDFSRLNTMKAGVQHAADAAAIAGAKAARLEGVDAIETARQSYWANVARLGISTAPEPAITLGEGRITVTADDALPSSLLQVVGIPSLSYHALAAANIPGTANAEIVMVLDYSTSMQTSGKWGRMKDAAESFLAAFEENPDADAKIGFVPFSEFVYAPVSGRYLRGLASADWANDYLACTYNRDYPYSVEDAEPNPVQEASRWAFSNYRLADGEEDTPPGQIEWLTEAEPGSEAEAKAKLCENYDKFQLVLQELTDDYGILRTQLGKMKPIPNGGLTNISLASEMGWHVLTDVPPYEEGVAADSAEGKRTKKVMILLTDGEQTVPVQGPGGDVSVEAADIVTQEVCTNVKADGIEIFTIAYDLEPGPATDLLVNCASSEKNFYATGATGDLKGVFQDIFDQIAERIRLVN